MSSFKVNLQKSEIIPIGEVEELDTLASLFGCKVGSLSSIHLGLPLGAFHKTCIVRDLVEERLKRRFTPLEETILIDGRKIDPHKEYPLKPSHMFHVPYYDA